MTQQLDWVVIQSPFQEINSTVLNQSQKVSWDSLSFVDASQTIKSSDSKMTSLLWANLNLVTAHSPTTKR